MRRYMFISTVIFFLFSCSRFSWESRGEAGEKCFDNGTCTDGLVCVENSCEKQETSNDEDSSLTDNESDDKSENIDKDAENDDSEITPDEHENDKEADDNENEITPDDDNAVDRTYFDAATGYTWQMDYSPVTLTWDEAVGHCNGLIYAGFDDWRLPTVSELRSLVAGCSVTESTGGCNVKDTCLDYSTCRNDPDCNGCENGKGPSQYKCYFSGIEGSCAYVWSISTPPAPYSETHAWYMDFSLARISTDEKTRAGTYYAICVR